MITSLLPFLKTEAILLTPNQRLAATLIKQYNHEQLAQGQTCWPTAKIRPLVGWIQELWEQYTAREMDASLQLLTANQELILWEELIAETPESEELLKLSDLAKQAKAAWSTLKSWRTDFHHPSFSFTENCRYFQTWAEQFVQRCEESQWIDSASLTDLLIEKIQEKKIFLPRHLVLLNFTELTPQYKYLLKTCDENGVIIEYFDHQATPHKNADPCSQIGLSDEETEIQTMALWAKKILEQEPNARIGCIASQLEEKRDSIISLFNEVFERPESFNISAGKTLASYPIIQQALQLLSLSPKMVSAATLSSLLHSPFMGDAEKEMFKRIQFDSHLRRRNMTTSTWSTILEDKQAASCDRLSSRIKAYLEQRATEPAAQEISAWIPHFAQLLESLGWPGEQSLNSSEYQVVKCWMDLLQETASLDNILASVSYHKTLHYLTVLATKTYFQPETPEAPIQILGQLEGAGLPFTYLWVMGLDDTAWPPVPSPNPLIPLELQKSLSMPNATADRQLQYSLRLTKQYKQAASQVVFSYSLRTEKEELRPSPLIAKLPLIYSETLNLPPLNNSLKILFQAQNLEALQDEQAPPILAQEKLQGGVSIFEMQAACPFKAFAKLRLGARALEETEAGLPAKSRGSIIHKILELFWKEVKNHKNLTEFKDEDLRDKIHQLVTTALNELAPFIHKEALYHTLVSQRLENLLWSWLELEKTRPPFTVVAVEQEKTIEIDKFSLAIRVDRIDEVAEGEKLIIDYKTKKACDTNDWFGQRPDEPQLPLYCITNQDTIVGLAFAQLHTSNTELKGIAQKDLDLPSLKTITEKTKADALAWEGQLTQWQLNLTQLFRDFQSGNAEVDPKNPAETCRYCDLQTLCRIHEDGSFSYD